jgi:hypothetical protein
MRSKISLDEEAKEIAKKQEQFRIEINKTAYRMKQFAAQYEIMIENKNILNLDVESQEKIIKFANIIENFMDGQKQVISEILKREGGGELVESASKSVGESSW